jgi:glycosyltransferase involved in cell wall biosynthesis
MKIALITHQFFPDFYTGVERLTLNLANQLARMGNESVVVTAAADAAPYTYEGIRVRPIVTLRANLARPWEGGATARRELAKVLREEKPDVVHVMQPMRLPWAFENAYELGLPLVAHLADFFYICARVNLLRADGTQCTGADGGRACAAVCDIPGVPERLVWAESMLREADAVISPSRFAIDVHASQGFDTSTWERVPWGVDYALHPDRLPAPASDRLAIGFLGSLVAHKGAHVLVEAMRLLEGRDLELVLYGESFHEGGYEAKLRALAAGDDRIRFAGRYDHAELPHVLAPLDVVAIPSLWHENLPTTGLNAVAAGVPLIVSDVGGLEELIDDYECGFTFTTGDPASLARLLERLLDDRAILSTMRRRMAYPPSLEEEAWRLARVYADVVDAEGVPAVAGVEA